MLRAPDAASARLFVEGSAACALRAWARPEGGGWSCGLGPFPAAEGTAAGPFRPPPDRALGERPEAAAAGVLLRLAGVSEEGAAAVEGGGGWRWAQANLPSPEAPGRPESAGLLVLSGAEACVSAAAPDFAVGVEGESRLVPSARRGALSPDPAMASWLACGAALSGARVLAEAGPAESEAAVRWCREARLPVVFIGGEPAEPIGPARLAELVGDALRDAEAVSVPGRVAGGAALSGVEALPAPPAPAPAAPLPAEAPLRSAPPRPGPRPPAFAAAAAPAGAFLEAGAGALETALAGAASAACLRPSDLFVFSASGRRLALAAPQAWGLGEGAAPAAAGARLHDPSRKCVAVVPAPRGMALGWLLHLAARNADLVVVADGADAATLAGLGASGLAFHARLRPEDGKAAEAALEAALRHRGLAFVELSQKSPTAVLLDAVRPRSWEEAPA